MRNTTPFFLLLLLFLFNFCTLKGQESTAGFDTIFHQVDTVSFDKFHFDHPNFKDVSFKRFKMKLHSLSSGTNIERQFSIDGLIVNETEVFNWQVVLIGKWKKKIQVEWEWDSDEGLDFDFPKEDKFYWGNSFTGSVLSGTDTIANFSVYKKPAKQEIFSGAWKTARSYKYEADPLFFKDTFRSLQNFGISGIIDSIPFKIIYIEPVRMAWIFKEDQLKAVFLTEDFYTALAAPLKGRLSPQTFLLLKPGHTWDDEAEMIRLSILTLFIADAVRPENIN
jgi:hypothetical protein